MDSRIEKYSSNASSSSRTSRNKDLYDDLYKDTSYNNAIILDQTKEIDISKIKEIIDGQKNDNIQKRNFKSSKDLYEELKRINQEEKEEKVYDINQVLREAKEKRNIIEDANEKRKIKNDRYISSTSTIEEELSKTRKLYSNLLKEETELLDIMNTLTNVSKDELENEMFKDLTETKERKKEKTIEVTQINNKPVETKEYNTNTFLFDDSDFERGDKNSDNYKKTSKILKFFTFILTVIVIFGVAFLVKLFVLK